MKVILLQDVKKMGLKGDVVEVAEGYARNYLMPRKLAVEATQGHMNDLQQKKASEVRKNEKKLEYAEKLAESLGELIVKISAKVGEGGRLFGSITSKDICDALKAQHKIDIDKKKMDLDSPIKSLGVFPVTAKLHPRVQAKINVHVVEK
ncbi:50S ribosomal protein L9 [Phosphitispora sp. TUW77]|uniref:50S ribosomal protein L9 n=1 Tax=Phosphitispora sp. TUW77 TaxID=3152361 RepID=UPI003AB19FF5